MFRKCPVKKVIFPNQHIPGIYGCEMFRLDSIKCIFNYNVSGLEVSYHLATMSLCLFLTHMQSGLHTNLFLY